MSHDHPHDPGQPHYHPRDIADALATLCTDEDCRCAIRLAVEELSTRLPLTHHPAVSLADGGWGVYCFACSHREGTWVYPCREPADFLWPSALLVEPPD
jgi:hypothetical protein